MLKGLNTKEKARENSTGADHCCFEFQLNHCELTQERKRSLVEDINTSNNFGITKNVPDATKYMIDYGDGNYTCGPCDEKKGWRQLIELKKQLKQRFEEFNEAAVVKFESCN